MTLDMAHKLAIRKSLEPAEYWSGEGVYVAIKEDWPGATYIDKPMYEHRDCSKRLFILLALYVNGKLSDGYEAQS